MTQTMDAIYAISPPQRHRGDGAMSHQANESAAFTYVLNDALRILAVDDDPILR